MSPHVCRRHCHENWINFFASEILENKKGGTTTYVYVLCIDIRRRRKAKVRVGFACEYLARVEIAFGCAVCQYSASAKSTNGSVVSFIGIRELYPVHRLQVYLWLLDHTKLFALWKIYKNGQKNANKYISDIRLDDKIDLVLWEKGILNNYLTFNFLKVLYGISNSPARIFIEHTQMSLLKVISSQWVRAISLE